MCTRWLARPGSFGHQTEPCMRLPQFSLSQTLEPPRISNSATRTDARAASSRCCSALPGSAAGSFFSSSSRTARGVTRATTVPDAVGSRRARRLTASRGPPLALPACLGISAFSSVSSSTPSASSPSRSAMLSRKRASSYTLVMKRRWAMRVDGHRMTAQNSRYVMQPSPSASIVSASSLASARVSSMPNQVMPPYSSSADKTPFRSKSNVWKASSNSISFAAS
mmetsp:Transcript_12736/g.36018  ORF Transcript_12736/g.36018 Transcript_12736/m.36018 type:complete len:224 (-) Transcript_12736:1201-1872(-)